MSKKRFNRAIDAARGLRERHPDDPEITVAVFTVALTMATFADWRHGTRIFPGHQRLAEITGLHPKTVQGAIRVLLDKGEIRLDKRARPGSAAAYTYIGGMRMVESDTPPLSVAQGGMVESDAPNGGVSHSTHHPYQPGLSQEDEEAPKETGERLCITCGVNPTEPWHSDCFGCIKKAQEQMAREERALAQKSLDDNEIRRVLRQGN